MKKKIFKLLLIYVFGLTFAFAGCSQAKTTTNNIQKQADEFKVYRKMTFVNLYTGQLLYSAEGYFSIQTTLNNDYQGQQELALIFKIAPDEYKMDYFSIAENVCYVIEQTENTHTDPYYWDIVWYIALPNNRP
jgi:hypothetical protein